VLRIRDVYPGYRIPDPTTATKYHKIVNNFILEQVKKFFKAKTIRIIVLFTPNFCH
jgi:hypothetical protein